MSDLDAAIQWYGNVFGFRAIKRESFTTIGAEAAFVSYGDIHLEMLQIKKRHQNPLNVCQSAGAPTSGGNKALVLKVKDLALATEELESKGVEFVWKNMTSLRIVPPIR